MESSSKSEKLVGLEVFVNVLSSIHDLPPTLFMRQIKCLFVCFLLLFHGSLSPSILIFFPSLARPFVTHH